MTIKETGLLLQAQGGAKGLKHLAQLYEVMKGSHERDKLSLELPWRKWLFQDPRIWLFWQIKEFLLQTLLGH